MVPMKDLTSPHDHFFKEMIARPTLARSLVESYFRPEQVALLELSSLRPPDPQRGPRLARPSC